jgi:hypothetical protein
LKLATYVAISNRPNIDSYSESHKKFAPNYFKYWFVEAAQRHLYLNNKRLFERWPRESEWASARVIGWCCQSCLLLKSWRNPRTDLGRKWRGRQVTQKTSNLWNLGLWKLSLTDEGRIFCWNLKCTVVCQRFFLPWLNFNIFFGSSSISDFGCYRCMACPIRPAGAHWFENWKRPATVELQRDNNLWFVNDNSGKRKFKVNKCKFESEVEKSLKSFEWKVSKLVKLVWSETLFEQFCETIDYFGHNHLLL